MSGDIITHIDGQRVTTLVGAAQLLGTFEAGEVIPMRIRRNGETRLHRYHLN